MSKLNMKLNSLRQAFVNDESGQDMVEYTILTGMIVIAVIGSVKTVATWVTTHWATLSGQLT